MDINSLNEQVTANLDRPFAVSGRRAYLIGHMDGSFPDLGHHLPGEMGGLWTPPIKLADGFWFGLSTPEEAQADKPVIQWMYKENTRSFTMKPGSAEREFALVVGGAEIAAHQDMCVPDHEPGVLLAVKLTNNSDKAVDLVLSWLVRFDIQGAWWSEWPDRPDEAAFDASAGAISAFDSLSTDWAGAMLGEGQPSGLQMGANVWAAEETSSLDGEWGAKHGGIIPNPAELQGGGNSGLLHYPVSVAAGESKTLRFVVAGGLEGKEKALALAQDLLARYDELLSEKISLNEQLIANAPVIQSPRPDFDRIFATQNLCLDMMTLDVPGVARGAVGGLQGFAWFFGCDSYYTVDGLIVAGQAQTALGNLGLLGAYAAQQKGRVPHEITQTGAMFNPGNTVETPEFVTAVERTFRWTGDQEFLARMYPVCREGIFDFTLGECDPQQQLLPDGAGLLELSTAHHGKKLDVACSLYQGLQSLAYLASAAGDQETADKAKALTTQVRDQINAHFWLPERQEYVWRIEPDLSALPDEPAHTYAVLEMGLLDESDRALVESLFVTVEGPAHTGPRGVIHPGTKDFVMPIQNAIVALAEFRYSRPDKGLWYLERMADEAGYYMPWAIPEFVGHDSCFLQAWSSAMFNWLIVQGMFRLQPDPLTNIITVRPQLPSDWDSFSVSNLTIWGGRYDLRLDRTPNGVEFSAEQRASGAANATFQVDTADTLPATFA